MLVGRCFSIYSKRKISVSGQLGSDRVGGHRQLGPGLTRGHRQLGPGLTRGGRQAVPCFDRHRNEAIVDLVLFISRRQKTLQVLLVVRNERPELMVIPTGLVSS